jgi:sulfatase maturation enzyme AslB (radical SAM superfamily)
MPQDDVVLEPSLVSSALKTLSPIDEFCIVGGEPLIYAEAILSILSATAGLSHRTVIVTNGVLMNPKLINQLARYNIHLVISIDTLDRDFWHYVRGVDSYDQVMENLEYACQTLSAEQLSIQSVRARETEPFLGTVHAFCQEHGIYHSVQDYVQDGFDGKWSACVDESDSVDFPVAAGACHAAERNLSIDPQGNVNTCFQQHLITGCGEPLGNLKEDTMATILSSAYTRRVQTAMHGCSLPCRVLKCNKEG